MTDKLFRDGKIYLSINDAVAMAHGKQSRHHIAAL